jgi:hypothetical protein
MKNTPLFAVLVSLAAVPAFAQSTITCSSNDGRRHLCRADTSNGVVLVQERSDSLCRQGSTWGYNRSGIYVSGGCSADFQVGGSQGRRSDNDSYGNGYDNDNNDNGRGGSISRPGSRTAIPANTRLRVRLNSAVSIASMNAGDSISGTLARDLVVGGNVIAPEGTPVQARVIAAPRDNPDALDIRLDSMTVNGRRYALDSTSIHSARDNQQARNSGNNGAGQIGALVGALTGQSQAAELPAGSVYDFTLVRAARPE